VDRGWLRKMDVSRLLAGFYRVCPS